MAYIPPFLHYTIPNILGHFGQPLSPQATAALEDKEAYMRKENESHRVEIIKLQGSCTALNRSLEEEIRIRNIREKETGKRDENEQLLPPTNSDLSYCHNKNGRIGGIQMVSGLRKTEEEQVSRMKTAVEEKERVITELQAEICKLKGDICELKNGKNVMFDLEGFKRILEENGRLEKDAKVNIKSNIVLSREKEAMESELDKLRKKEADLVESNHVLSREKEAIESELDELRRKVNSDKNVVAKIIKRAEEDRKKKIERIDVLERKNESMRAKLDKSQETISSHVVTIKKKNAMIKRMEDDVIKRTSELVEDKRKLAREKEEMEEKLQKDIIEMKEENERILNEKAAVEAVKNRVEAELKKKGGNKSEMEDKLQKDIMGMRAENERILNEKAAVEVVKNRVEVELKKEKGGKKSEMEKIMKQKSRVEEENSKLIEMIQAKEEEVLKSQKERNSVACRMQNMKKASEQMGLNLEKKDKEISDLEKRVVLLKSEKAELEAAVEKVKKDKSDEADRNAEVEKTLEAQKKQVEELEVTNSGLLKVSEALAARISKIKNDKLALEEEKNQILDHVKRIEVLERENAELKAKVCKVLMDKKNESEKAVKLNKDLQTQILDHVKRIEVLERQNGELKAKVCKVLMDQKEELQAKVLKLNKEKSKGIERTERLEREKEELQAEVLKLNKEKSKVTERLERILKILNGNLAEEAEKDYEKKNLELGDRIIILEKEKMGFVADLIKKNEKIVILENDKRLLEDMTKELEMKISEIVSKSKEGTYSLGGTLTTPLQNEGQNTVAVHRVIVNKNACKRKRSQRKFDWPVSKLPKPACEPLPISPGEPVLPQPEEDLVPCEKIAQMVSTTHSNGSSVSDARVACRWEVDQDVLDALDVDDELCLKAVCALYRKHTADASTSSESRVFKEQESTERAITIGEYLTIEDPDCRKTKKMVGKLNKIDNLALGACRTIAKEHYKQVFEIYNKKEDPLYLS